MTLKAIFGRSKKIYFFMTLFSCFLAFSNVYAEPAETQASKPLYVAQHDNDLGNTALTRLNRGFVNIATAPLELVNQPREEFKKTNPVYGLIPGAFKGVGWAAARGSVGVWEVLTFYIRDDKQPHLPPMDLGWLTA